MIDEGDATFRGDEQPLEVSTNAVANERVEHPRLDDLLLELIDFQLVEVGDRGDDFRRLCRLQI